MRTASATTTIKASSRPTVVPAPNVEPVGKFSSMGDVLREMVRQDKEAALGKQSRQAVAAGLEQADESVVASFAEQFLRRPYLLAECLIGIPIWPCGKSAVELMQTCRDQIATTNPKTIAYLQHRAAERALTRLIDAQARLEVEGAIGEPA